MKTRFSYCNKLKKQHSLELLNENLSVDELKDLCIFTKKNLLQILSLNYTREELHEIIFASKIEIQTIHKKTEPEEYMSIAKVEQNTILLKQPLAQKDKREKHIKLKNEPVKLIIEPVELDIDIEELDIEPSKPLFKTCETQTTTSSNQPTGKISFSVNEKTDKRINLSERTSEGYSPILLALRK